MTTELAPVPDPTADDYVDTMVVAARNAGVLAGERADIDMFRDYPWMHDRPIPADPEVEVVLSRLVSVVAGGYARAQRARFRPLGWTAVGAAVLAVVGALLPFDAVRWNLFGGLAFFAVVAFICWVVPVSNAGRPSGSEQRTLDGLLAQLRDTAYPAYVATVRRRRAEMLVEAGYDVVRPPRGPRPEPQRFGVSHQGAEEYCAAWMRHLGAADVVVTQFSGDGGVDIIGGSKYIAQVKNYTGAVGVAEIRDLAGVASVDDHQRRPLFFTSGTYPPGAVEFANRAGIALFRYDAQRGTLDAVNAQARQVLHDGL